MKRNEFWVTTAITSIICLVLTVIIVFSGITEDTEIVIDAGQNVGGSNAVVNQQQTVPATQQVAQPVTQAPTQPATQAATQAPTQPSTDASAEEATTAVTAPATTEAAPIGKVPSGNEEILKKYNDVIAKAKSSGPAHKKVEYQAIPEDKVNFEGGVFNKILPLASNFFTTEEDARANPEIREKGNDMYWFPPYKVNGCLLTDASV